MVRGAGCGLQLACAPFLTNPRPPPPGWGTFLAALQNAQAMRKAISCQQHCLKKRKETAKGRPTGRPFSHSQPIRSSAASILDTIGRGKPCEHIAHHPSPKTVTIASHHITSHYITLHYKGLHIPLRLMARGKTQSCARQSFLAFLPDCWRNTMPKAEWAFSDYILSPELAGG